MSASSYKLAVLSGDGIGPEVMESAMSVLETVGQEYDLSFESDSYLVGGSSIEKHGIPITDEVLEACKDSDAVLLGAVGGPEWDSLPQENKPEKGLLQLREALGLYSNLRPATIYPSLVDSSSLKPEVIQGSDIMVVRELTGGIYFGKPRGIDKNEGWNTLRYSRIEVERIAKTAFELARLRDYKVTSVHKANVLESSQFWRDVVADVHKNYSDVMLDEMYVDNAAMQLVRDPKQFDVILTQNMFGDILSDITAMLTGSLGMLPSASVGEKYALYEPVHGTAPEIAVKNIANPIAMIASIAMMLEITCKHPQATLSVNTAIESVLASGYRTAEVAKPGDKILSTSEITAKIIESMKKINKKVDETEFINA